jgi:uncharacterized protein YcbK (DUF882 family)
MVHEYEKGTKVPVGRHFTTADFDCHCRRPECRVTRVDDLLVESLDALWDVAGPFGIDSGFRCHAHNAEVGGADNSRHQFGDAADCKSKSGYNGNLMARYAERIPAFNNGGVGIYPTFAHCDTRGHRARWSLGVSC